MVYDEAARIKFLQLSYEDALRELAKAVDRHFGEPAEGEERLSDLLKEIREEKWKTSKRIKRYLKWLEVGRDSLADRAYYTLLKRHRLRHPS